MRHYTALAGLFACVVCLLSSDVCLAQPDPGDVGGIKPELAKQGPAIPGKAKPEMKSIGSGDFHMVGMIPSSVRGMSEDWTEWKTGGEMGYYAAGVNIDLFGVAASYDNISFAWNNVDRLPFGNGKDDPWRDFHSIKLAYTWSDMLSQDWGYFATAEGTSRFEKEMDDSFGASGVAGIVYLIPEWRPPISRH